MPPTDLLGHRRRAGRVPALWEWIEAHASEADALIGAWEAMAYGGLVASRRSDDTLEATRAVTDRLERLAASHTGLRIYLAAVNARLPVHGASREGPDYWAQWGSQIAAYSEARDRGGDVASAARSVPSDVLDDVLWLRRRNLVAILDLCALASRGVIHHLLVGQDDTPPVGLARSDLAAIRSHVARSSTDRVLVTHGADELCLRLLARATGDLLGVRPRVEIAYTWPQAASRVPRYESAPLDGTVREHLESVGATVAESGGDAFLLVHNFPEETQPEAGDPRAPDVDALERARAMLRGHRAAKGVADVRYANGADDLFARMLLAHPRALGIAAYAGWNTASNTLGTALAHLILAWHAREGRLPASGSPHRQALLDRFLDDWGYQAVVRPLLLEDARGRGVEPDHLREASPVLRQRALDLFRREVLPALTIVFGAVALESIDFPWGRLFEAEIMARAGEPATA